MQQLLSADEYHTTRPVEIKPARGAYDVKVQSVKPIRKFHAETQTSGLLGSFRDVVTSRISSKDPNAILNDSVLKQTMSRHQTRRLLDDHIRNHLVKIGKKYYRQKTGIPQGSVVSSILCSFLYAAYESTQLSFLKEEPNLLLRLIDDFLLITPSCDLAARFLDLMLQGNAEYGVFIKPEKSLVNFAVHLDQTTVPQLGSTTAFPYCGMTIDTRTLDVRKDQASSNRSRTSDTLTVEFSKLPGESFKRKMLSALAIQMHTMLLDTTHNSIASVLSNMYLLMSECATRTLHYIQCLPVARRPSSQVLRGTYLRLRQGLNEALGRSFR